MRIAIVTSHPVPYHLPLYRALAQRSDVDLEVLFSHDHGVNPTFDKGFGCTVQFDVPLLEGYRYRFPRNYAPAPSLAYTGQINPGIALAVARGQYDAVVVHGYRSITCLATLLTPRILGNTRLLMRSETTLLNPRSFTTRIAKQALVRLLFRRIDHFLAIGSQSRAYFEAYGAKPEDITVAPYSVDNDYFERRSAAARQDPATARARLGLPIEGTIFLYCSKVAPHKRPLDVLRAFAIARKSTPCTLVYVGDGASMDDLKAEIVRHGLSEDVLVLGFRNQSELPEIYGACDVFVLASEMEPWGMVVNEAMASGMAVCLSDAVGSAYDLIRDNGAMFPVGDIQRLAALFTDWARHPDKLAAMKEASRRRIGEWSAVQTAEGVITGVRKALASVPARLASSE